MGDSDQVTPGQRQRVKVEASMDFELNEEQQAIQRAARDFAEAAFDRGYALDCDRNRRFPTEVYKQACEQGLVGVHFPKEYGGRGYGVLEEMLVIEALCSKDPGLGIAVHLRTFGSELILRFGTEEMKRKILPGVTTGEIVTGAAFTEPDHGSDISDLTTIAVRDGEEWVINGTKTFITNGLDAQFITVLAKTDPGAQPTYRGQTMILVDTKQPGFEATDLGEKMGQKMLVTTELSFRDVRAPTSNVVGQENRGFYQTLQFFDEARVAIAAQALGGAQAAFDRALAHVKRRRQFGKRLADLQAVQHKIADMATKIETARLITYHAAWSCDRKGANSKLTSMAKNHASRIATEVAEEAVQLLGGSGYFVEGEVERIYRDIRVTEIYEGTREIQKNIIASHLLGKE
jgi:alkylation response protein AidB-like acyl-CoA dehydrogenase